MCFAAADIELHSIQFPAEDIPAFLRHPVRIADQIVILRADLLAHFLNVRSLTLIKILFRIDLRQLFFQKLLYIVSCDPFR